MNGVINARGTAPTAPTTEPVLAAHTHTHTHGSQTLLYRASLTNDTHEWKNEWGNIYEKDSESYKLIDNIYNSFYLVFIVDNDFINSNIYKCFE